MLKTSIIGNLGADAVKRTGEHSPFYSLSVAHTKKYVDKDGVINENTIWCNVIINWDASKLMPYLLKGTKIYASGQTRLRCFKGNEGNYHASIDIIADTIELCGSPKVDTLVPDNMTDKATNNAPL